jgi:hypothetical protein
MTKPQREASLTAARVVESARDERDEIDRGDHEPDASQCTRVVPTMAAGSDQGKRDSGNGAADHHSGPQSAALEPCRHVRRLAATLRRAAEASINPCGYLAVDLLQERVDGGLAVLRAKFVVRCRRSGDILPCELLHGDTIHLD